MLLEVAKQLIDGSDSAANRCGGSKRPTRLRAVDEERVEATNAKGGAHDSRGCGETVIDDVSQRNDHCGTGAQGQERKQREATAPQLTRKPGVRRIVCSRGGDLFTCRQRL